jgi:hypothetical protein
MLAMAGRPKSMETRKIVSLPAELARAIEDYRFANRLKTEAEAIRQLIDLGLKAAPQPSAPADGIDPGGARKPGSAAARQRKPR